MGIFADRPTLLVTGRAATALYLLFRARFPEKSGDVILPANICHAAVYPVLHAGLSPVLCDIDPRTGNATVETVRQAFTRETRAVVLPHMSGTPVRDAEAIAALCRTRGAILIEDCASALGAEGVGSLGDDVIYSTGHAKIVDLGWGGILCTGLSAEVFQPFMDELYPDDADARNLETRFGQVYRAYLNSRRPLAELPQKDFFRSDFRRIHLRLPHASPDLPACVCRALPMELALRRERWNLLSGLFEASGCRDAGIQILDSPSGAVPWRFSFLVSPENRPRIASALLSAGLPVSDWYPSNADFFASSLPVPGAEWHGHSILNLPLTISDSDACRACDLVVTTLQSAIDSGTIPPSARSIQ